MPNLYDRFLEFLSPAEILEATPALLNDQRRRFVSEPDIILQPHSIENVQEIMSVLMEKVFDLRFVNTICFPTRRNHEQIKELAAQCDVMIVIGSFTSANSKRLTQLALERNKRSYQVTTAEELDISWFNDCETVGISAGASTPDEIINDVVKHIKIIGRVAEKEIVYE